jgi:hypothetical protein
MKTKKILVVSIVVCIIGAIVVYNSMNKEDILKVVKEIKVEYGNKAPTDVNSFVDTKLLSAKEKEVVLKNAKVDTTTLEKATGEEYPALGEYHVVTTYKQEKGITKVIVEDTTAPVFDNTDTVILEVNGTIDDLHELVGVTDLQFVVLEFALDTLDITTIGEYTVKAIATDDAGNIAEKDIKVIVTNTPIWQ